MAVRLAGPLVNPAMPILGWTLFGVQKIENGGE